MYALTQTEQTVEVRCAAVYALSSLYSRGAVTSPAAAAAAASAAAAAAAAMAAGMPVNLQQQRSGASPQPRSGGRAAAHGRAGAAASLLSPVLGQGHGMVPDGAAAAVGRGGGGGGRQRVGELGDWPVLVPESAGGGTVPGTSEMRRLDELDIASRLAEHVGDAR